MSKYQLITTYLSDDYEPSEESLLIKKEIEDKLKDAHVSKTIKEFEDNLHPGDILLVRTPRHMLKSNGILARIYSNILAAAQRSPFSSIKVCTGDYIYGYGVKNLKRIIFTKVKASNYLKNVWFGVILRHKKMTPEIVEKIEELSEKYKKLNYDTGKLISSFFKRIIGIEPTSNDDKDKTSLKSESTNIQNINMNDVNDELIRPMICSSIIALIFKQAGCEIHTDIQDIYDIWPSDIFLSEDMEVITRLEKELRL